MKSIALVTYDDDRSRILADLTAPVKEAYCRRHGYAFMRHTAPLDHRYQPPYSAWNKLSAVCRALSQGYQWVMWSDADAVIIRPEVRLVDLVDRRFDFIFGTDLRGINTGNFLVQNTRDAWGFLTRLIESDVWSECSDRWEQRCFHKAIADDWHVFRYTCLGDFINAHPAQCSGKFIVHCYGMHPDARLMTLGAHCGKLARSEEGLWIEARFGGGRYAEFGRVANVESACDELLCLGWDGYVRPATDEDEPAIAEPRRHFNVLSVSRNSPPVGYVPDYAQCWSDENLSQPALLMSSVVGVPGHLAEQAALATQKHRQVHRTDRWVFLS